MKCSGWGFFFLNNKQQLEYLLRIRKIREVMVVKDNIHLTYKYKNRNHAFKQVENLQDKIINHVIDDVLFGNVGELKNIEKTTSKIINDTLVNERKRIHRIDDRFVNHAVKSNTEIYSKFFNNRLNNIKYSLQLRIEEELRKNSIRNLSDSEIRKILSEKYADTGKARLKNIVKDSIHTNESNISFIQALNEGYSYKVWMNGRSKGKTRPWHRASIIDSVPIDEPFYVYHAEMMYPGDLNGGAENVANCRCWLRYTNKTPSNLKSKSSFNIPPNSYLYGKNKSSSNQNALKVTSKIKNKVTRTISNIKNSSISFKTRVSNISTKVIDLVKRNIKSKQINELKKSFKDYSDDFVKDYKETTNTLKKLYPEPQLSNYERENVAQLAKDSTPFNEYLKRVDGKVVGQEPLFVKSLYEIINRYSNIKENTVLHRYVRGGFFLTNVGKTGTFDRFISTSFNPEDVKKKFGKYHIIIFAPKGANIAYIEETLNKYDGKNHLNEVLFPPETEYVTLYKNHGKKLAIIIINV